MFRFAAILLIALGLASCGQQGPSVEGKWAWFDGANCEGDRDTIEFAGADFFHRREGEVYVPGHDVVYQVSGESGAEWVTATYVVSNESTSRTVSLTFEPQGENTLIFRGSVVDGVAPRNASSVVGRELYRCRNGQAVMDDQGAS